MKVNLTKKKGPTIGRRYDEVLRKYSSVKHLISLWENYVNSKDDYSPEGVIKTLIESVNEGKVSEETYNYLNYNLTGIYMKCVVEDFIGKYNEIKSTLEQMYSCVKEIDTFRVIPKIGTYKSTNKAALDFMSNNSLQEKVTYVFDMFDIIEKEELNIIDEDKLNEIEQLIKSFMIEYKKLFVGFKAGAEGEAMVKSVMDRNRSYKTLYNVWLPTDSGSVTEIDSIVITPGGVFVLEVKNIGTDGGSLIIEPNGDCVFRTTNGDKYLRNYIGQNSLHRETLSNLFYDNNIDAGVIKSALVLTNKNVDVILDNNELKVVNQNTLGDYIANGAHRTLSRDEIDTIYEFIKSKRVNEIEFEMINYIQFSSLVTRVINKLDVLDALFGLSEDDSLSPLSRAEELLKVAPDTDSLFKDLNDFIEKTLPRY